MGNTAAVARTGRMPDRRSDGRADRKAGRSRQRYRGSNEDAQSQTKAVFRLRTEADRVTKIVTAKDCGNAGLWTARKTKNRFSSLPTSPWKSLPRFPHSRSPGIATV